MLNEKGFSIIQVMVAAGIFAIISLAMTLTMVEQRKATNFLEDQIQKIELVRTIESVLKDSSSCEQTFTGLSIPTINNFLDIANIKDNNGNVFIHSNTDVNFLKIGQMRILNKTISSPSSSGFVELIVPFNRARQGGGTSTFKPFTANILLSVDNSNIVTSCSATASSNYTNGGSYSAIGLQGQTLIDYDIPGQHDICVFSGFKTTEDDSNNYDGCRVVDMGNRVWHIQVSKHRGDTLRCFAQCFSFN